MTATQFDAKVAKRRKEFAERVQTAVSAELVERRNVAPMAVKGKRDDSRQVSTSKHESHRKEDGTTTMSSLTFIKHSDAVSHGTEGKAAVSVGQNGQFRFLSKISEEVDKHGFRSVLPANDGRKMVLILMKPTVDKITEKDLPEGASASEVKPLNQPKKGENLAWYFSGIGVCRRMNYDSNKSGNQTFDAEFSVSNGSYGLAKGKYGLVTFHLPEGSATPKPVRPRKKRTPATAGTQAETGSTNAAPAPDTNTMQAQAGVSSGIDLTQ